MISHLIASYRQRKAMKRLAELRDQTLASPDHIVWKARREAALKGLARRQKMEAQG